METTKWGATNKDHSSFPNGVISEVTITLEVVSNSSSSNNLGVGSMVVCDHRITSAAKSLTGTTMMQLSSSRIIIWRQTFNSNNLVKGKSNLRNSSSSNNLDTLTRGTINSLRDLVAIRCLRRIWASIHFPWAKCQFKVTSNSTSKGMTHHKSQEFQTWQTRQLPLWKLIRRRSQLSPPRSRKNMTISSAVMTTMAKTNREVGLRPKGISIDPKKTQDLNAKGKINQTLTIKEQRLVHRWTYTEQQMNPKTTLNLQIPRPPLKIMTGHPLNNGNKGSNHHNRQ